jgi:hypothetical protein
MKLSPEERAANREAFIAMSLSERIDYIFAYYKLELVIALIIAVAGGSILTRTLMHKDAVLYLAYTNVAVGNDLDEALNEGFVRHRGLNTRKSEVYCYHDLFLSDDENVADHRYAYASRMKLLGAVDAGQLDVVIMNKDAYDILSSAGYLDDLSKLISKTDTSTQALLTPKLVTNKVILEDNKVEYDLNEAESYEATTAERVNAVDVSGLSLFKDGDFSGQTYLGVIANSPRKDAVIAYLEYLSDTST